MTQHPLLLNEPVACYGGLEVCIREPDGRYREAREHDILFAAQVVVDRKFQRGVALSDPNAVKHFLRLKYADLQHEVFSALWVDSQNRLIAVEDLAFGTLNAASVYPREVLKAALKHNASAVIFAHNHPSGVAEPSGADRSLTDRLRQALGLVDLRVLDHLVVGGTDVVSFAERGWI